MKYWLDVTDELDGVKSIRLVNTSASAGALLHARKLAERKLAELDEKWKKNTEDENARTELKTWLSKRIEIEEFNRLPELAIHQCDRYLAIFPDEKICSKSKGKSIDDAGKGGTTNKGCGE